MGFGTGILSLMRPGQAGVSCVGGGRVCGSLRPALTPVFLPHSVLCAGATSVVTCDLHGVLALTPALSFSLPSSLSCAGATSVVACDLQESLCDVARKAASANGLSNRISVVHRDAGLLQRGREVRPLGVNLVVADMFDAGAEGGDRMGGGVGRLPLFPLGT